jgi:hypothetical protein
VSQSGRTLLRSSLHCIQLHLGSWAGEKANPGPLLARGHCWHLAIGVQVESNQFVTEPSAQVHRLRARTRPAGQIGPLGLNHQARRQNERPGHRASTLPACSKSDINAGFKSISTERATQVAAGH